MTVNHGVLGSSPCSGARRETMSNATFGSLAQLVQSICLTSRGSAVRIRQLPLSKTRDWNFRSLFFCCMWYENKFSPPSTKKQLASQLSRLCSLEIGGVRVKGGCGNKNIFIFKGIPASATPVESVNSHKPNKQKDVEKSASFFVLYGIAKLVWICNVKQKMMSHRLLRV